MIASAFLCLSVYFTYLYFCRCLNAICGLSQYQPRTRAVQKLIGRGSSHVLSVNHVNDMPWLFCLKGGDGVGGAGDPE